MNLLIKRRATAIRWLGVAILTGALGLGGAGAANAQTTFASFGQASGSNALYSFVNNNDGTASFNNTGTQVKFQFTNGAPPDLQAQSFDATLKLYSATDDQATTDHPGIGPYYQNLDGAGIPGYNVLTITDNASGGNLLTAVFQNLSTSLTIPTGIDQSGAGATLVAQVPPDSITFSSQWITFAPTQTNNYLADTLSTLTSSEGFGINTNTLFLNDFQATSGSGNFATDTTLAFHAPTLPEPPFVQLGVLMLLGGLVFVRRKRVGFGMPRMAMA